MSKSQYSYEVPQLIKRKKKKYEKIPERLHLQRDIIVALVQERVLPFPGN